MCNIRGYRHTCNHIEYRFVSTCRGTFATKFSPNNPLCLSRESSDIIISIDDQCMSCNFQAFKQEWEDQISEKEKERDHIQARLFAFGGQGSDWWAGQSCGSASWETDDTNLADYWFEFDAETGSSFDELHETNDARPYCDEEARLRGELATVQAEVDDLRQQFGQDMWQKWRGYFGGSRFSAPSRRPNHWRRRLTSPKTHCGSPLRHVTGTEDGAPSDHDHQSFSQIVGGDFSTDEESDYSDSPTLSMCSSLSDDGATLSLKPDEPKHINASSSKGIGSTAKMARTTAFAFQRYNNPHPPSITQMDEPDADMLPNWFDFYPSAD